MSALVGYCALGTVNPVSGAFTEASFAGYARQPVACDLDRPANGGAVETGGDVLRNVNPLTFPKPTGLDWPSLNAYAVFTVLTGGAAQVVVPLGARSGVHARGTTRPFRAGTFVIEVRGDVLISPFGGRPAPLALPAVVGGALTIGTTSLSGQLPGSTALSLSGAPGSASIGKYFSFTPTLSGGYGPRSFALTGTLPDGLTFSADTGTISGLPTALVTTTGLVITGTDDTGSASLAAFSIVVGTASSGGAPSGFTYLADPDGSRLTDPDGAYLMEAA